MLDELRVNEFVFHLLLKEVVIQPTLLWEGRNVSDAGFVSSDGAGTLVGFVTLRAWALDYIAMELCSVAQAQARQPALKRRILEALNGHVGIEDGERLNVPTIFDLYDFQLPADAWEVPPPSLVFYDDVELDTSTTIYQLRALQDQLLATEPPGTVGPIPGIPKA